jgi:hypothetical protein
MSPLQVRVRSLRPATTDDEVRDYLAHLTSALT